MKVLVTLSHGLNKTKSLYGVVHLYTRSMVGATVWEGHGTFSRRSLVGGRYSTRGGARMTVQLVLTCVPAAS